MCGIVGKFNFNPDNPVSEKMIENMNETIIYRGPDDHGLWCHKNVGLGHRRLSIIDLSSAGHQPMLSHDNRFTIVFNGEIYNFKEIKKELIKKGCTFRSQSDTEVILSLYEKYEEQCVQCLRGMFAFAIWDNLKKTLFLARDRFGKKPLKYYIDDKSIIFASELKAILKDPQVTREVDYDSINHYLTFHYIPAPTTGFKGIFKLPQAHYMIVRNNDIKIQQYWDLNYSDKVTLSNKEIEYELIQKLKESVSLRLISDVPLGAFLSGGIDSSAIVAMMSHLSDKPVKTFSIGFEESDYNELQYARIIAQKYSTEHHEFIVKPNAIEVLPKLAWHYEEPYADSSALPTYYLAELTRQHVTVALNGDGGDENFAGYTRYQWSKVAQYITKLPISLRKMGIVLLEQLNKLIKSSFIYGSLKFTKQLSHNLLVNYFNMMNYYNVNDKELAYTSFFKSQLKYLDSFRIIDKIINEKRFSNEMDSMLYLDFHSYVPDDLMVKVDIATMAHSLESRSPLLDHQFVEFVATIEFNSKLKGFKTKNIFKKALKNYVPHELLYRKKMGFGIPIDQWLRKDLYDHFYHTLMNEQSFVSSLIQKDFINRLFDEHLQCKTDHSYKLWALLMLELWYQTFFQNKVNV